MFSAQDLLFVFFFQAEDGIRDRNVTGVQTCALPISWVYPFLTKIWAYSIATYGDLGPERAFAIFHQAKYPGAHFGMFYERSEERRVGKECRSRWWTYY